MNNAPANLTAPANELEATVDDLIAAQKEEQDLILKRDADKLPAICAKIEKLGRKLEEIQARLGFTGSAKKSAATIPAGSKLAIKLRHLQDLAYQNHLLLDNSLHFLQEIFREVMGLNSGPPVYKHNGSKPAQPFGASGMLLNMQI